MDTKQRVPRIANDRVYHFMQRTWMLQQLPLALALYVIGGMAWVIWGICARVTVSIIGHWLVGWFAHNRGARDWHVAGAAVQGHNVLFTSLLNHAFFCPIISVNTEISETTHSIRNTAGLRHGVPFPAASSRAVAPMAAAAGRSDFILVGSNKWNCCLTPSSCRP